MPAGVPSAMLAHVSHSFFSQVSSIKATSGSRARTDPVRRCRAKLFEARRLHIIMAQRGSSTGSSRSAALQNVVRGTDELDRRRAFPRLHAQGSNRVIRRV